MMELSGASDRDKTTGLTVRQEAFLQGLLTHKDMMRAYTEAYTVKTMTMGAVLQRASDLMDNVLIQKRYRDLTGSDGTVMYNRLTERQMLERFKTIAFNDKLPANIQLRALELLGKTNAINLFAEQHVTKDTTTPNADELEQLLMAKLSSWADKRKLNH